MAAALASTIPYALPPCPATILTEASPALKAHSHSAKPQFQDAKSAIPPTAPSPSIVLNATTNTIQAMANAYPATPLSPTA
jgi:hypothetical protein